MAEEQKIQEDSSYLKMDYTLESPQERNELVKRIIDETPSEKLTPNYINALTEYIFDAINKQEKKEKKILTENRLVTVNKRETSYEGLVSKLENGEDGIYNMITNDKNIIFTPKISITAEDVETIPGLKELRDSIEVVEAQFKAASGKRKFLLKKQLIEMRQDQYVLKNSYKQPIYCVNGIKSFSKIDLYEHITIDEEGNVHSDCLIDIFNPKHISLLLINYSKLKEETYAHFTSDAYYLIKDLEDLVDKTLKDNFPMYFDLIVYKIDGKTNDEIQELLYQDYGIKHSVEYISSLWRNKIPKMLAKKAEEDYIIWYYSNKAYGQWKRCSRCHQYKVVSNKFFSKNKTSKDGYYSICKECRNVKKKQVKLIEPLVKNK